MAREMQYTDARGTTHAESFWTSESYTINVRSKWARFVFVGFVSRAAANSGKEPITERIVAECDGEVYQRYMTRHLVEKIPVNQLAYELADELGLFPNSSEA